MTRAPILGELVVLDDVGTARRGRAYPAAGAASLLLAPAGLLLAALVLWPVVRTVQASVTDPGTGAFVGIRNFRLALSADGAWPVVGRTLLWAVLVPTVVTVLGCVLAASGASRRNTEGVVRLVLIAPIAVPLVVTGVVFRLMYDPNPSRGIVSGWLGVDLLGPRLVTIALMTAFVWAWVGLAVMAFRRALDIIPAEYADAVRSSGGTRLDVFRDAVWRPLLRRTVAVVFVLVALGTARTFDLILIMTPGSVRDEASVLAVRIWQTSGGSTSGPAAALGVLWLAAVGLGMLAASLGIRQAWPPPSAPVGPRSRRVSGRTRRVVTALAAVAWAFPLLVLVATAFHGPRDAATRGWWSTSLRLASFTSLFSGGGLARTLVFTVILAVTVTAAVLAVALAAAYPLAWLAGPPAQGVGALLLAASVVPVQVIAGPINEVLGIVRLTDTSYGLALVHLALGVPFAVLLLRNALADVPAADLRRARLTGRHQWQVLWQLRAALGPALIAVSVLEFVQVWNDLVVGLLFSGPDGVPLGLYLYGESRQFVANSGPLAASSVIAAAVPVLVVILARKKVIAGLVAGTLR